MDDVTQAPREVPTAIAPAPEMGQDDEPLGRPATSARLTPLWLLVQLVPSPEIVHGDDVTRFGMRWQVTPVLYSFGVNRRVSPWRAFIVEPFVRQSGSIEVFVGPEYIPYGHSVWDSVLWRAGARVYLPVLEYGDYLSVSLGASYFSFAGDPGAAYELGVYGLFGIFGAQLTWSPSGGPATTIATLRLRYF